mgnify:CR=1 FL=1
MNMMIAAGKEVAATPDVYSGEPGKSAETYRGLATRVEQATKPLTAIAQRLLRQACPSSREKKPMDQSTKMMVEKQFADQRHWLAGL